MTNWSSSSDSLFFLPKLREGESDVRPGLAGRWDVRPPQTYQTIATSLDLGEAVQGAKSVTSIPNIWARALLVETALHNLDYPLRSQLIEQWEGMLAAIALAEIRQFDLKVQLIELGKAKDNDVFARALYQLRPEPDYALYTLKNLPLNEYNPWLELYVFLWNGKPVGITSPSTLICPSEDADWAGLPWFQNQRLSSPIGNLNADEKALLWRWLENLSRRLPEYGGRAAPRSTISGLLEQFRKRLSTSPPSQPLQLSQEPQFFGAEINRGALSLLNLPIKAASKPSSVRVIPSAEKSGDNLPELLLIDPELDKKWNEPSHNIFIYDNKSLASTGFIERLKTDATLLDAQNRKVKLLFADDLFLDKFHFIDKLERALPNTLLPSGAERLTFNGQTVTPLIPINQILLEYFTPEDLVSKIKIEMDANGAPEVKVSIDIPLSGLAGGQPKNYHYERKYLLAEQHSIPNLPVLEIWPDFKAKEWKEYYAFYYDQGLGDTTFQVGFANPTELPHQFELGKGVYIITRLEQFPACLSCCSRNGVQMGLIFLQSRPTYRNVDAGTWRVGVDFGTSFTNVYINKNGTAERLVLEPLNVQVTRTEQLIRDPVLVEFFTTDNKLLLDLPLSSVLTTRMARPKLNQRGREQTTPFLDGCIYIPQDSTSLKTREPYIKTGLKWSTESDDRASAKLFLKHLALKITALAARSNIGEIEWFVSYPSAFSITDQNTFSDIWEDIASELEERTGVRQTFPKTHDSKHWRSESVAVAQYFADQEKEKLVGGVCVDIGGGTSDISIWENYRLVHQCSIQLAGRDLFTQFVQMNPKVLESHFEMNPSDWSLNQHQFSAKLDVLLRKESEDWLRSNRDIAVKNNPDFQELLQLMALGTAGLYYYIGIILKTLRDQEEYKRDRAPAIYLGGNGSRFLNWLAEGGRFDSNRAINGLLSWMLIRGAGLGDGSTKVMTKVSSNPKDEVACGLVLDDSSLLGWDKDTRQSDCLIAGEFCVVNGQSVTPYQRLPIGDGETTVTEFIVPRSYVKLREFIDEFNAGVQKLKTPGIKPIQLYDSIFDDITDELDDALFRTRGKSDEIRIEPPFVLSLKALLRVLGRRWSEK